MKGLKKCVEYCKGKLIEDDYDWSLLAFMLRDCIPRKDELWGILYELAKPYSGYTSKSDIEWAIEKVEKWMKENARANW